MTTSPNSLSNASTTALSVAALIGSLAPAAVLMFLGQPAHAQMARAPQAAEVRIDLAAKTPDAIRKEVSAAVSRVCTMAATHSPLLPREQSDCRKATQAEAMSQLNPPASLLAARD